MISLGRLILVVLGVLLLVELFAGYQVRTLLLNDSAEKARQVIGMQGGELARERLRAGLKNLILTQEEGGEPAREIGEAFSYSDSLLMLVRKAHTTALEDVLRRMAVRQKVDGAVLFDARGERIAQYRGQALQAWAPPPRIAMPVETTARGDRDERTPSLQQISLQGETLYLWRYRIPLNDPFGDPLAELRVYRRADRDVASLERVAQSLGLGWMRLFRGHLLDSSPALSPVKVTGEGLPLDAPFDLAGYMGFCSAFGDTEVRLCALESRAVVENWDRRVLSALSGGWRTVDRYLMGSLMLTLLAGLSFYWGLRYWLLRPLDQDVEALEGVLSLRGQEETESDRPSVIKEIATLRRTLGRLREGARERTRLFGQLDYQSLHDEMTGLPNRRALHLTIAAMEDVFEARRKTTGLMLLHLRNLGRMSEHYGLHFVDRTLQVIGEQLQALWAENWHLFHLGGSRFLVITHREANLEVAAHRLFDDLDEALAAHQENLLQSVDLAIAWVNGDDFELDLVSLIRQLLAAEEKLGKDQRKRVFRATADLFQAVELDLAIERALPEALLNQEFELAYQPICETGTGRLRYFEVLLRWRKSALGEVGPGRFIPIAEVTGHIIDLGELVLRKAMAQLAEWDRAHVFSQPVALSVNLSPLQLNEPRLAMQVLRCCDEHGVALSRLVFEVTESDITRLTDAARHNLRVLRKNGARLAIDDFGTGYSSLGRLLRIDAQILKLDRAFIALMDRHRNAPALVRAVVHMASEMGMMVVAEGVETMDQYEFLCEIQCDAIQGYLVSKPMPPEKAAGWRSRVVIEGEPKTEILSLSRERRGET
ncbi:MAG: GGDEF domain-containing protein [Gammaproteobacteria bacterium]|nr:MAG: GGDEF domain-containing protein [Gammaproteobacteria bacterium]